MTPFYARLISMNDTNCIFCKIVAGEVPCDKVYEDGQTIAFLDIKPVNPGHILVIPKEHHSNITQTPDEILGAMISTAKKVAQTFPTALNTEHYNLEINTGAIAGQVVFHAHLHIIPRHEGDGLELWHGKQYEDGQSKLLADKIKNVLI